MEEIDAKLDGSRISADLDARGFATVRALLSPEACAALAAFYDDESLFRKTIAMARYNFGRGEYKYFKYPLPDAVVRLRTALYPKLADIANGWNERLGIEQRFPDGHQDYLARCHAAGQRRPTPLLLKYGAGDYNCLHQDLYGEEVFPLQATILLTAPENFTGGEFILTEQRPRLQSRAEAVRLGLGDCIIFAVRQRPVKGTRGYYRTNMRHGVSTVLSGKRQTLGLIFHDAA